MPQTTDLQVHLLPTLVSEEQLRGGIAVVIDVLRASTTITQALASRAAVVIPTATVPEAHMVAAELAGATLPGSDAEARVKAGILLGGERDGTMIPGFDLDNSPMKYSQGTVAGKTIVFTTTNGTLALLRCHSAARTLIACFNNLHCVVAMLASEQRPIHLICAGTNGAISTDDALCAGAIATGIWATRKWPKWDGDELRLVLDLFTCRCQPMRELLTTLRESQGGRNLIDLGLDADIERAARWDLFRVVPEFDPATRRIHLASDVPAEVPQVLMAPRE